MKILITGSAGFIGYHLHCFLHQKKFKVLGCDNLTSVSKKTQKMRLKEIKKQKMNFIKLDLKNFDLLKKKLQKKKFDIIIHLAAQPGVRISQKYPNKTLDNNLKSFVNIFEFAKIIKPKLIIYASSSSVYGNSKSFIEDISSTSPVSIYGVSKLTNEYLSKVYNHLYQISSIGLRFFTVYGPYGREDMSYYKFINSIKKKKSITIYGDKTSARSFTYIDDIVLSIFKIINKFKNNKQICSVFNIGSEKSRTLDDMINILKKNISINFKEKYIKRNKSDVYKTKSNNKKLIKLINFSPKVSLEQGINQFCQWYKEYISKNLIN